MNDQLIIEALAHPVRRKILRYARSRTWEVSPAEISKRLGEDLCNLSYHVRCLAAFGLLTPTHTRQVRGVTAHFYEVSSLVTEHPILLLLLGEDQPGSPNRVGGRK